jgi:hypothetical protein
MVIGGWQDSDKQGRSLKSQLLGYYDPRGKLVFAGKAGTGSRLINAAWIRYRAAWPDARGGTWRWRGMRLLAESRDQLHSCAPSRGGT